MKILMSVLISEEKNINCLVLCCFYSRGQKSAFMEMLKIGLNNHLFKNKKSAPRTESSKTVRD